ncbi:MAG: bifunctional nuclease family protein [bacterium]|nr:bifunctional nuclease family protein [bacterium]
MKSDLKRVILNTLVPTSNFQFIMLLEEVDGTRILPIWIGSPEGQSILFKLTNQSFPRPLTHDLIVNIMKEMNIKIESVVINDIKDNTFYAVINLTKDNERFEIDSRPSDAVAIAIRTNVPIFVANKVFESVNPILKPITEEEVERFKKELENLKPSDLFKKEEE